MVDAAVRFIDWTKENPHPHGKRLKPKFAKNLNELTEADRKRIAKAEEKRMRKARRNHPELAAQGKG